MGAFDGGAITSNDGVVLLAAADKRIRPCERLARCFIDHRVAASILHEKADLLRQRIFGLGHEDLIDHDALRHDPALTAALDKPDGVLAGKSTLNRLEHAGKIGLDRHHKLDRDPRAIERLFVDVFMEAHREPPIRIVLDLDATDDPLHGELEGRHFRGYYDCYCYLPLYIFCERHLLAARLRSSSVDAADGSVDEVALPFRREARRSLMRPPGSAFAMGFSIPIPNQAGQCVAVSFAADDRRPSFDACIGEHGAVLQFMAVLFHRRARALTATERQVGDIMLSSREFECLEWASRGKSAWDIGRILNISRCTAAFHLGNAKKKLGVRSISQAVAQFAASHHASSS